MKNEKEEQGKTDPKTPIKGQTTPISKENKDRLAENGSDQSTQEISKNLKTEEEQQLIAQNPYSIQANTTPYTNEAQPEAEITNFPNASVTGKKTEEPSIQDSYSIQSNTSPYTNDPLDEVVGSKKEQAINRMDEIKPNSGGPANEKAEKHMILQNPHATTGKTIPDTNADKTGTDTNADATKTADAKKDNLKGKFDKPAKESNPDPTGPNSNPEGPGSNRPNTK